MPKLPKLFVVLLLLSCTTTPQIYDAPNPAGETGKFPRLFTDNSGMVYMSWMDTKDDITSLYYSKFNGVEWSEATLVSSSESWFVNWADFPAIIGIGGQAMASHWLAKVPGNTYSYNVELASLQKSVTLVPHNDGTATEHGFVSMVPTSDSTFYAVWLDGRNTAGGQGHDSHGSLASAMTIRGAELDLELNILNEAEIDNSTCDCCNTALAKTNSGLIVAYRDRTEDEIRDIYISRQVNGEWTSPTAVFDDDWNIAACPVNGPSLSSDGTNVAIAWFSGANDIPRVKVAFSGNEGAGFSTPFSLAKNLHGSPLGRVDIELINAETAWVSWLHRGEESGFISLVKVNASGEILDEYQLTDVDVSRSSGFPQITKLGDDLLLAWTDVSGAEPRVRTAILQ
jgi:hypothetical protein